jgi:hypothetical protein
VAAGADEVVLATGSWPPGTGFQRALPMVERLPGVDGLDVFSIHDVLDGRLSWPRPRPRRLGDWRGTAPFLAERVTR